MTTYSGKPVEAAIPAAEAYAKLTNLSSFGRMLEDMPEEVRSKMGDVTFNDDEIVIGTPQVGNVTLRVTERREPELVKYSAVGSPVPLSMNIVIEPQGDSACKVSAAIEVEIPAMLRPLIGSKMQEAADKFGDLLSLILRA